jgi:LAO/AO transport system kinase
MKKLSTKELKEGILAQNMSVLSRAITLIESKKPEHRLIANELLNELSSNFGEAKRIGISGTPGVGKSTFIQTFTLELVKQGHKVAVLAVDPSSVKTGGSILGDKTRMGELIGRDDVYIRPSPTSLELGGVASKTRESIFLCEAFGFDTVIVETVGVGQSEVTVSGMVDSFIMLTQSNTGDELQGIKRGILEVADFVLVNKSDGDNITGAKLTKLQLENALHILRQNEKWMPKVSTVSALKNLGVSEFINELNKYFKDQSEIIGNKRKDQRVKWMWSLLEETLREKFLSDKKVQKQIKSFESSPNINVTEFVKDLFV